LLSAPPADTALFPLQIILNALLDLFRQLDGIINILRRLPEPELGNDLTANLPQSADQ
jgi:hypothetical protein